MFGAILEKIKNNGRLIQFLIVKNHGSKINLHPLIKRTLTTEIMVLKKDYGFVDKFNIISKVDNKGNKLYEYKSRTRNKINTKNTLLNYLRIM